MSFSRICTLWLETLGNWRWSSIQPLLKWLEEESEPNWSALQRLVTENSSFQKPAGKQLCAAWSANGVSEQVQQRRWHWLQTTVPEWSEESVFSWIERLQAGHDWQWYTPTDEHYPQQYLELEDPPAVVWGSRPLEEWARAPLRIAVVGSRRMSAYGRLATHAFVSEFVEKYGAEIVSGAAYGIDTAAHQECLASGGRTIAILPQGCRKVGTRLRGLVGHEHTLCLTEFPPDFAAQRWAFAQRNRLISALADVVFVVEATEKSGTFLTAAAAFMQGKEVCVLTQPRQNPQARGICELIEKGAHLVCEPNDVLKYVKNSSYQINENAELHTKSLSAYLPLEQAIFRYLAQAGGSAFELTCRQELQKTHATEFSLSEWVQALASLEVQRVVQQEFGGAAFTA